MGDMADDAEDRAFEEMVEWDAGYRYAMSQKDSFIVEVCEHMLKEVTSMRPAMIKSICEFYQERGFITEPQKKALAHYWADYDY